MSPTAPRNKKLARAITLRLDGYLSRSSRYVLFLDHQGELLQEMDAPLTNAERLAIRSTTRELLTEGHLQAVVHAGVADGPFVTISFVENYDEPTAPSIHALATGRDHQSYWISMADHIIDQWLAYWQEGDV